MMTATEDHLTVGGCRRMISLLQLLDQLRPGGRLVIPVGSKQGGQNLEQYDKQQDGSIKQTSLMGVIYVPLTSKEEQLRGKISGSMTME